MALASMKDLIVATYQAASDNQLWPWLVDQMAERAGASSGFLISLDSANVPLVFVIQGASDVQQRAYRDYYMERDIVMQAFRRADVGTGWAGTLNELLSDRELLRSEYYNDYMRPMDHHHQVGATLGSFANVVFGGASFLRSRSAGEFDSSTLSAMRQLAPHLRQSLDLRHKLATLERSCSMLEHAADAYGIAAFGVDCTGRVLDMTSSAENLVRTGDVVRVRFGQLQAGDPQETNLLHRLIRDACGVTRAEPDPASTYTLNVRRPAPKAALSLTVHPFQQPGVFASNNCSAIVFAVDRAVEPVSRAVMLQSLFGLTPYEGRFADEFGKSHSIRAAAETLRMTENSGRAAIKSIFCKTGTNNQAALIRLLLSLPSLPGA